MNLVEVLKACNLELGMKFDELEMDAPRSTFRLRYVSKRNVKYYYDIPSLSFMYENKKYFLHTCDV